MTRRGLFASALALATLAAPVAALDLVDSILASLKQQGYVDIEVSQTLLGRTRIVTHNAEYSREIIVNPGTGEILRDYWELLNGSATVIPVTAPPPLDAPEINGPNPGSSGSGSSGSGSGSSGSGNSGSGSGGSGSGGSGSGSNDD